MPTNPSLWRIGIIGRDGRDGLGGHSGLIGLIGHTGPGGLTGHHEAGCRPALTEPQGTDR